jgi:hypothetical protein
MRPFWETAVKPLLDILGPATLVEIGAAAGAHTVLLAAWAANSGAVLHVVDPSPAFDVDALQERYPCVMHRELSTDALSAIASPDVVLLDGDHNWYTVQAELRLLARHDPWPVTLIHDIDWPYGRRDMYYDADRIPAPYRHPFQYRGIVRGQSALSNEGMNANFANAIHEGGPRNGVLTAIEDFVSVSSRELQLFAVTGPAGLGLLVDRNQLDANETLAQFVQRIHDPAYGRRLSATHSSNYFAEAATR